MKISILSISTLCLMFFFNSDLIAQDKRTIEVTGSAEMLISPDEFIFEIGIEEYWEEEFKGNTKFEDYQTKVDISTIEGPVFKTLMKLGIEKDDIKSTEVGNYWRYRGKDFLIAKKLEVSLNDFNKVNEIISSLNKRGIDYMRIGQLKHKNITQFRKEVKIKAIKAAKEKAEYLVMALGEELGDVISIIESDNEPRNWIPQNTISNVMMESDSGQPTAEIDKKIKLRYEINVTFEIR